MTIQSAVNAADPGETVIVSAGTYNETVTVDEDITITGAGIGSTIIAAPGGSPNTHRIVFTDSADGATVENLTVQSSATQAAGHAIVTDSGAASVNDITLSGLFVDGVGRNPAPLTVANGLVFSVPADNWTLDNVTFQDHYLGTVVSSVVTDLAVTGSVFSNNQDGFDVYKSGAANAHGTEIVDGLTMTNTQFSGNYNRGLYIEALSNAVFDGISVASTHCPSAAVGCTFLPEPRSDGLQLNLKFEAYENIQVLNSTFTGNDRRGISVQVRGAAGDSGSYTPDPAHLNALTIDEVTVSGNGVAGNDGAGIQIDNHSAVLDAATVSNSIVDGNLVGLDAWRSGAEAITVVAEDNWWGDPTGPTHADNVGGAGDTVTDGVDYVPFCVNETCTPPPPVTRCVDPAGGACFTTIQAAVNAANSGDTINVAAGTYDEQVVVSGKDVTLNGAGDSTVIQPSAPSVLDTLYTYPVGVLSGWEGVKLAPVVLVENSNTTIQNLLVDGSSVTALPSGAGRLSGILYGEAGGLISGVSVDSITGGYTLRTYSIDASAVAVPRSLEIANSTVDDFARTAIQVQGDEMSASIHDNTIVGPAADQVDQVPNGIVFMEDAVGSADNNTISGLHYTGPDASSKSAGLMAYRTTTPGVTFANNQVSDVDDGVILAASAAGVTVGPDNNLSNNAVGVQIESGATNNTVSGNTITSNSITGIRVNGSLNPGPGSNTTVGPGNVAHLNDLSGNAVGVINYDGTPRNFDATQNWWGSPAGPVGLAANVLVDPWCVNSSCTTPTPPPTPTPTPTPTDPGGGDIVIPPDGEPLPEGECDPETETCGSTGDDDADVNDGTVVTGPGDDHIDVDTDGDTDGVTIDAGEDNDTVIVNVGDETPEGTVIDIDGGEGDDTIIVNIPEGVNVEIIIIGGDGDDTITYPNFEGLDGVTVTTTTGEGDDIVNVPAAPGTVRVIIRLGSGNDAVAVQTGVGVAPKGASGAAVTGGYDIYGGAGGELIEGSNGTDYLLGGRGRDALFGKRGHDVIKGGKGADSLFGGKGDDTIYGGKGKDIARGGPGTDQLIGI